MPDVEFTNLFAVALIALLAPLLATSGVGNTAARSGREIPLAYPRFCAMNDATRVDHPMSRLTDARRQPSVPATPQHTILLGCY